MQLSPPDPARGLTLEEAEERKRLGLTNTFELTGIRTTRQIVLTHTLNWFNFLNLFLGILVFLTGSFKHMLFLGIPFCNTLIGIVQELRVRKVIQGLVVVTAARCVVLREGEREELQISEIVRDDLICLKAGDQIVADGPIISGEVLEVNESMLTGEAKPVRKRPGDCLLSGSFVVTGEAVMQAEKVGRHCYASKLVAKTRNRQRASSEMLTFIRRIIRYNSYIILPLGILLYFSQRAAAFAQAAARGLDSAYVYNRSILFTVSGILGMIPEGLVLLTSVSFIIGVGRLAFKGALVQEMEAMEALARADILCTDKTGTITTGELRVCRLVTIGDVNVNRVRGIVAHLSGALKEDNLTEKALIRYFGRKNDWTVTDRIPFSSQRKYKAAAFAEYGAYVLGAPEVLSGERESLLTYVQQFAEKGYRCLLLCSSDGISSETGETGVLTPLSLIVISDVIRSDAKEIFSSFARSGVTVKVLSGDHPATVSAAAAAAGIEDADTYMDASSLPEDSAAFAEAIGSCNIFGRVRPEQKQAFIKAWQSDGHTVAMVGDGVNDVLALKQADCGVAMAEGADAARHAAHIVLAKAGFSAIRDIVGEGRTIICNLERVSSLYLTKTIYAVILCLLFILLRRSYPWTTLQMGLINLVGIGMPSFLLTLETHEDWRSKGFLPQVIRVALPSALAMVFAVLLLQPCRILFGWPEDMYALFSLMLGGLVSLLVVAQVCRPFNLYRSCVWGLSVVVLFLGVSFLPDFYDIHVLWTPWSLLLIPMGLMVSMVLFGLKRLINRQIEKRNG